MPTGDFSRQHLVMAFIALFLVVQLVVPVLGMFGPRPGRFSWQMYSGTQTPASFEAVHRDGSITSVDASDYLVAPRLEMNLLQWLPQHVCSVDESVTAVRVDHVRQPVEEVTCSR